MVETSPLNRIKVALVERQKSSKWLADTIKKSPTTVSRWVTNTVQPSLEQLYEIAAALEMDVRDLIVPNIK